MQIECKHCNGLGFLEKEGPSIWIMHDNFTFTKIEKDWDLSETISEVIKAYRHDAGSMLAVREYEDGPIVDKFSYHGQYEDKEKSVFDAVEMIMKVKEWQRINYQQKETN